MSDSKAVRSVIPEDVLRNLDDQTRRRWKHSWWCNGDPSDCRFNGCTPPVSGVAGNPEGKGNE